MANRQSSNPQRATSSNGKGSQYGHLFGQSTRKSGLDADWNEVDGDVLVRILWAITYLGGSVTAGTTKNNNAYFFKVFLGAPYDPQYFDGDAEGREKMREWSEVLVAAAASAE